LAYQYSSTNTDVSQQPNLIPPLTTIDAVQAYHTRLTYLSPNTKFLMSLYLSPAITPSTIAAAAATNHIYGVKSYPAGVTTNSAAGVVDYESFFPVFAKMEEVGMVLNLHGELPSTEDDEDVNVMNAEEKFLVTLREIVGRFRKLKIVLEHCTSKAAVECVQELHESSGGRVCGTITAHHLFLTVDDVVGDPMHFCKPVAKTGVDRRALLRAVVRGKGAFFFGSDSAPHGLKKKYGGMGGGNNNAVVVPGKCAAGVFAQPYVTQLVLEGLERAVEMGVVKKEQCTKEVVEGFLGGYGRKFYGVEKSKRRMRVVSGEETAMEMYEVKIRGGEVEDVVVPFRRKEPVYSLEMLS
jgi:dihydroorotase